jgi:SAM-dependent methyltransferase
VQIFAVDKGYERGAELERTLLRNSLSDVGDSSLDLAFLMDVLEHEQDDRRFLEEVFRKVKPGGRFVIAVPTFPFLFSAHDRSLGDRCLDAGRRPFHHPLPGCLAQGGFRSWPTAG